MVTKKVLAKKTAEAIEPKYHMPREVADWIERAESTINHLKGQVAELKEENKKLKQYQKWAENRILRSDHEE